MVAGLDRVHTGLTFVGSYLALGTYGVQVKEKATDKAQTCFESCPNLQPLGELVELEQWLGGNVAAPEEEEKRSDSVTRILTLTTRIYSTYDINLVTLQYRNTKNKKEL